MNGSQAIPSRADIDVHGSLDEVCASANFLGKSLDEAEALFRENSLRYQEDLLWMGPVAFRFYIHAAINYVQSEHATGDSDIIRCLASTLSFWHEHYPAELVPCARTLADFCRTVLEQFDRFDADLETCVGLREQYQHLAELFTRNCQAPLVTIPPSIHAFWKAFILTIGHDPSDRFYEAFHFDDNAPDADGLAALVLSGRKRATASLVWTYEAEDKPIPKPGDLSVVTLFSGKPVCVIETQDVKLVPFTEVDADFAAAEGEGDGSLAHWQRVHTACFGRECQRLGREFSLSAPVVCERFTVVYQAAGENAVHPC